MQQHAAGHQRQTANTSDHQRLERGAASRGALCIETDQQERGDGGQFPKGEQRDEAVGEDEAEHRAHKDQQDGHEAAAVRVAPLQIGAGVDQDEGADARNGEAEDEAQAVDQEAEPLRPRTGTQSMPNVADRLAGDDGIAGSRLLSPIEEDSGRHDGENPARGEAGFLR